ncbi:uncharacterized protein F5Z01DRAFT_11728 [Emericellopsis atlantica]|uniref:Uncharacterized protein n=1 Tax=Emericellopsis atlantica TaxID=2614577 RepID=A0A9P7ZWH2_9HYPO|nr:uncharacterized protein F5Z01DRAFT_11728 [Emericellopsis atlantica]KAG9258966.1 hypothetical protein F5Z01DRAFT_11728 [Emericellopsis atlantica]
MIGKQWQRLSRGCPRDFHNQTYIVYLISLLLVQKKEARDRCVAVCIIGPSHHDHHHNVQHAATIIRNPPAGAATGRERCLTIPSQSGDASMLQCDSPLPCAPADVERLSLDLGGQPQSCQPFKARTGRGLPRRCSPACSNKHLLSSDISTFGLGQNRTTSWLDMMRRARRGARLSS